MASALDGWFFLALLNDAEATELAGVVDLRLSADAAAAARERAGRGVRQLLVWLFKRDA